MSELEICNLSLITSLTIHAIWTFASGLRRLKVAHCTNPIDRRFPHPLSCTQCVVSSALSIPRSFSLNRRQSILYLAKRFPILKVLLGHNLALPEPRSNGFSYYMQLTDIAIVEIVASHMSGSMALCGHTTEALSWLMDYGVMSIACACTRPKSVDVRCESPTLFTHLLCPADH